VATAPLTRTSQDFINSMTKALVDLSGKAEAILRPDVAVEAANLTAAIIDADGRHTDDELWAYTEAFGAEVPIALAGQTPAQIRETGVLTGRRTWVDRPSALFDCWSPQMAETGGVDPIAITNAPCGWLTPPPASIC
jgi:hypothetical protein